jgi:hypothetical protein
LNSQNIFEVESGEKDQGEELSEMRASCDSKEGIFSM